MFEGVDFGVVVASIVALVIAAGVVSGNAVEEAHQ
jgi:hypothetical protein